MSNYQTGFGNHFASEAVAGALPVGRNSPQRPPFGLYAEQFSTTAFTMPRGAQPPQLALPPAPDGRARAYEPLAGFDALRTRAVHRSGQPQPPALGPAADARRGARLARRA